MAVNFIVWLVTYFWCPAMPLSLVVVPPVSLVNPAAPFGCDERGSATVSLGWQATSDTCALCGSPPPWLGAASHAPGLSPLKSRAVGCESTEPIARPFPKVPIELGTEAERECHHEARNGKDIVMPGVVGRIEDLRKRDASDLPKTHAGNLTRVVAFLQLYREQNQVHEHFGKERRHGGWGQEANVGQKEGRTWTNNRNPQLPNIELRLLRSRFV